MAQVGDMSAKGGPDADPALSTGELAAATGVSSRTIRYYEELGILPPPPRTSGGVRRYPANYRFFIDGAKALKEVGFDLEEVRLIGNLALGVRLSPGEDERIQEVLRSKGAVLERRIRVLERLREVLQRRGGDAASAYQDVIEAAGETS